ncbi:MAG: hypothetical protein JNN20_00955 [Betaproteobacteria bacterium]|nr:hypothetical protein [Betaproteobacteria bacterium]
MRAQFGKTIERLAIIALVMFTVVHVSITISTVVSYGFQHPFQDQYRLIVRYLTVPFPDSVLLLENGHRPIFPGLVRCAQLTYLHGQQWLEATAAAVAAFASVFWLLLQCRKQGQNTLVRVTLYASVLTLFWNANARMFIHAHEASHLFYVLLGLVVAIEMLWRHIESGGLRYLWGAIGACLFATFSFGPGFIVFAAVLGLAILHRAATRTLVLLVCATGFAFILYFLLLPGAEGVQKSGQGFDFASVLFFAFARVGAAVYELLVHVVRDDDSRIGLSALAGLIATLGILAEPLSRWLRRERFDKLEHIGIGMMIFGLVTNTLIAIQRGGYFLDAPEQLFADRYIFWSCVFWVGVLIYCCVRLSRLDAPASWVVAILLIVCGTPAIARADYLHAWSAAVYRGVEQAALSLKLNIKDDARVEPMSDLIPGTAYVAAKVMREKGVSLFSNPNWSRVGATIPLTPNTALIGVTTEPVKAGAGVQALFASGYLDRDVARRLSDATIWAATSSGQVIGRCALTGKLGESRRWRGYMGTPFDLVECYLLSAERSPTWLVAEQDGKFKSLGQLSWR